MHNGTNHHLGLHLEESDAARAYDAAARQYRPAGKAHGVLSSRHWQRLNFPTDGCGESVAKGKGMPAYAQKRKAKA